MSPANEHHIRTIESFERTIQPFLGLWRSLVIRVAWTKVKDIQMVVYLNATFETNDPGDISLPTASPAVDGLQAAWFVKPSAEIPAFVKDLKASCIQVDGKRLQLGIFRNGQWQDGGFGFSLFAQKGQGHWDPTEFPVAYLQESGSNLEADTGGAVSLQALKSAWLALPHPFKSASDVFREYFELKSMQSESFAIFVHARVPIVFGEASAEGGAINVSAPATADPKKISVGQIISRSDGTTQRGELKGDSLAWEKDGQHMRAVIRPSSDGGRIRRIHAILRYERTVLDECEFDIKAEHVKPASSALGDQSPETEGGNLSSDKPLLDPKKDRFGYAPFAKHLADCVVKMTPADGLVMALYGPWGSGKSTLLNFLTHYLGEIPEDERPTIVQFNPWLFSGHEDLVQLFFAQLLGVLKKWGLRVRKLRKSLAAFAKGISEVPVPGTEWGDTIGAFIDWGPKTIADQKTEVEQALRKQRKRILVVIDDIDRLVAEEIRQVFRLVKSVANFPNVTYLLAFDKEVAIKAIAELQHTSGEDYLEKIVQVPFELPPPDKAALRRLFFEKLDQVLEGTPKGLFDSTHWGNVYFDGIDHFISTPRDVMRLTNTLRVTYAAVCGEVNPVDFIAIDTLRVFCPAVYDLIRKNPDEFAGYQESGRSAKTEERKAFHEAWLKDVRAADRETVKSLLLRIFPRLSSVWGNTFYGPDSVAQWRKALKVCSPDNFHVYFRLALPEGSISATEMRVLLALIEDPDAFASKLVTLSKQRNPDGTTRLRTLLERFTDHVRDDISVESIPKIMKAFYDAGDELLAAPDAAPQGMFDMNMEIRIGRVVWQLLKRLDKRTRGTLLKETFKNGKSVALAAHEVAVLGQQHGKYGADKADSDEEQLVTAADLAELERIVFEKIRKIAEEKRLIDNPELPHLLLLWLEWGGGDEVRKWVATAIESDTGLITLLEHYLQKTYSHSVSDSVAKSKNRLNPNWIKRFADLDAIAKRLEVLVTKGALEENAAIAAQQFLTEYKMVQEGKNPDAPFAWRD